MSVRSHKPDLRTTTGHNRRALAAKVGAAALTVVVAALGIVGFKRYAAHHEHARDALQELRTGTAILSQLEWQAVAERGVSDELATSIGDNRRDVREILGRAVSELGPSAETHRVELRLERYLEATADEIALIAAGDLEGAEQIDERVVDPTFATLRDEVAALQTRAARRAHRAAAIGLLGTAGVLLVGLLVIAVLLWRLATAVEAARDSLYDPLTGLANRMLLTDRLNQALALAQRSDSRIAVLFLDLDDFKRVNDTLGHTVGDRLLRAVAERLDHAGRATDTIARLGGDEFAVVLHGITDEQAAGIAARSLVEQLEAPFTIAGHVLTMTASIGCALSDADDSSAGDLLRNADLAMYAGKRQGKRRVVMYEPTMYEALSDRLELENDLRLALARDEISVVYQPIVEVATGRLRGMEALARWTHPVRGMVGPALFIPLAEETGMIHEVGRFVLSQATQQLRRWESDRDFVPPLGVSVNVSPVQLQEGRIVEDVRVALRESGITPSTLTIEITESVLVARGDRFAEALNGLNALGVRLAVDDFGTGYSSLSSLTGFPIDTLKIDRSFTENLANGNGVDLVRSIVELGRTLGLEAVAEGVETLDQADVLRGLDCELGQGYHFAHPLTTTDVDDYLTKHSPPSPSPARPAEARSGDPAPPAPAPSTT